MVSPAVRHCCIAAGHRLLRVAAIAMVTVALVGCAAAAPAAPGGPAAASSPARAAAAAATPRPEVSVAPLALVVTRFEEAALPPAEPTPEGLPSGRPTPTPAVAADKAWKYITLAVAVENRSDTVRLAGISGTDPTSTNLSTATLTTPAGARFRPLRSYTSFGLRTATSRNLTNYPVLLRLPPGFRATAESFGALSSMAPIQTSFIFKVPADLTDYGTLTIPPLGTLGPKTDDEVVKRLRPLIGAFQPLNLAGVQPGAAEISYAANAATPTTLSGGVGSGLAVPGKLTVTLTTAEVGAATDYQARNRGWKQLTLTLRYRNDDPSQPRTFDVAAWFFGLDGVVYAGDVPALADFGRATTPPQPAAILLWDGRAAGVDQVQSGQEQEPRKLTFLVPNGLEGGTLVLGGDVEAMFSVAGLGQPPR